MLSSHKNYWKNGIIHSNFSRQAFGSLNKYRYFIHLGNESPDNSYEPQPIENKKKFKEISVGEILVLGSQFKEV